ncbi:unnamed protein product [Rhodiola kirilowii]
MRGGRRVRWRMSFADWISGIVCACFVGDVRIWCSEFLKLRFDVTD